MPMEYSKLLTTTWSSLEKINVYDTSLSLVILWLTLSLVAYVVTKPALAFLERRLQKFAQSTASTLDDRIHDYFEATHSLFLVCCALYCVKLFVPLGARVNARVDSVALLGALLQAGIWLQLGYSHTLTRILERSNQHSAHGLLLKVGRFVLWIFLSWNRWYRNSPSCTNSARRFAGLARHCIRQALRGRGLYNNR